MRAGPDYGRRIWKPTTARTSSRVSFVIRPCGYGDLKSTNASSSRFIEILTCLGGLFSEAASAGGGVISSIRLVAFRLRMAARLFGASFGDSAFAHDVATRKLKENMMKIPMRVLLFFTGIYSIPNLFYKVKSIFLQAPPHPSGC